MNIPSTKKVNDYKSESHVSVRQPKMHSRQPKMHSTKSTGKRERKTKSANVQVRILERLHSPLHREKTAGTKKQQ